MPLKTSIDEPLQLNLTSMIDVLFLLIIFFMAGTQFAELERNIDLKVPQVSNANDLPSATKRQVISIFRDGSVTLDREPVTVRQLSQRLAEKRKANPRLSVMVRGDGEGTFQNVASVLSACREAGISDLGVSVRLSNSSESTQQR
jgi:biopolymer transport protein ExbD